MWVTTGSRSLAVGFSLFFLSLSFLLTYSPHLLRIEEEEKRGGIIIISLLFCFQKAHGPLSRYIWSSCIFGCRIDNYIHGEIKNTEEK